MTDIEKIDEPLPPAPSECCGGGSCDPCVWDYYYAQRRVWLAQQAQSADADSLKDKTPSDF